jgi:hypothetical protein
MALVHGAFATVRAAGHARFSGWHPAGAERGIPGYQAERERESCETLDEHHHISRMLDGGDPVNEWSSKARWGR